MLFKLAFEPTSTDALRCANGGFGRNVVSERSARFGATHILRYAAAARYTPNLDCVKRSFYIGDMSLKKIILAAVEPLFDRNGFMASGMDRLTDAAGVSSRTLYKHFGSKTGLMAAVLGERDRRFRSRLNVRTVDAFFAALEEWIRVEGARGCLFLRALGETGGDTPEIVAAVQTQKAFLRERIGDIVRLQLNEPRDDLVDQLLVLFEGATAAAPYRGAEAASAARKAASILVLSARK